MSSSDGIEACCHILLLCVTCCVCYSNESKKRKNKKIQKEQREQLERTERRVQALERRQRQRELEDCRRNRANDGIHVVQISAPPSAPPLPTISSPDNGVAETSQLNRVNAELKDFMHNSSSDSPPKYEDVSKSELNKDIRQVEGNKNKISFDVEVKPIDRRKSF